MESDKWQVVSGKWKVTSDKWQVEEETPWGVSENIFIKFRQS